jgi:hypothetical protein
MKIRCSNCPTSFDPHSKEKRKIGGLFTHCPECAVETKAKKTGAMIYGHKTGATIQIQEGGPEGEALSKYLNRSVQSQRSTAVPVTHGAVSHVADVAQSRRGDTTVSIPKFELGEPMHYRPGSKAEPTKSVAAVWYDPSERKLFRIADGKLYEAPVEGVTWVRNETNRVTRLVRQKGLLASLLSTITKLIAES